MRLKRSAGWLGRVLGLGLALLFLANAGGPAVQAGSLSAYRLSLPVLLVPPGPPYPPLLFQPPPPPVAELAVHPVEIIQGIPLAGAYPVLLAIPPAPVA